MAATEEFTFPISSDTARTFIDSPPLWRRVDNTQPVNQTDQLCSSQRKSFSEIQGSVWNLHHRSIEMDGHDRMDLLWEGFNEEVRRKHNPFPCNSSSSSSDDLREFGCVPTAFRGGGSGGRAVVAGNKKVGVVVLAKVLKRLFLLRQLPVKKRSW